MKNERNDLMAKAKKAKEPEVENTEEAVLEKPEEEKTEASVPEEKKEDGELEKLKKQLDEKSDQLLRVAAEYDNFRKRSQREKDAIYVESKASIIKELLATADNFDRIFENADAGFEDYKKGVEMTYRQFSETFKKLGVEAFGEVGDEFDPNIHNAVMHSQNDEAPENTIDKVLQKGYKTGDKIIRPAMVAVTN